MKKSLLLLVAALLMLGALPATAAAQAPQPAPVAERYPRIIVKFKPGSATALGMATTHAKRIRPGSDICTVKAEKNASAQLASLLVDPKVEWAEPDYPMQVLYTSTPNDPDFADPTAYSGMWSPSVNIGHARSWSLRGYGSLNADTVWPYLQPSDTRQYGARADASAFPIAVIDTGFYMDHPDKGANIVVGKDMFERYTQATDTLVTDYDVTPLDPDAGGNDVFTASHGTCVAGEIAAAPENGVGTLGVAYDPIVRVYKAQGLWTDYDLTAYPAGRQWIFTSIIADAIVQATDDGCKVINMSLGGLASSVALQNAVNYAHARGVVVVAATGNKPTDPVLYPAKCENVIGVGSYNISGNGAPNPTYARSSFTSYGLGLDVLAPGAGIWGLIKPGYDWDGPSSIYHPGYFFWDGTSMASPLFAGGIAALWRLAPSLTNDEIANIALTSAHDLGTAGYDTAYGYGAFDMEAARQALVAAYPELAAPSISAKPSNPTSATVGSVSWSAVSGYNVNYDVALDSTTWNTAGTTLSLGTLSEGVHQVRVTSKSDRNWYDIGRSSAIFSFTVDRTAPSAPTVSVASLVASWATPPADVAAIQARVDGGPIVTLAGNATSHDMRSLGLGAGDHTVEVRFGDALSNFSGWDVEAFSVASPNILPIASFVPSPMTGVAPLPVHFDGSGSSDDSSISNYAWDFGDGQTESGATLAQTDHTYGCPGTYSATLTVTDDDGAEAHASATITVAPVAMWMPVYRFYRAATGTHFYTADSEEMARVRDTMATTYHLDGVGYSVNAANPANSVPLYRFYNGKTGTHLYTADESEKARIETTLADTYSLDGVAYRVSMTTGLPVHRFFSPSKGVHFYSADPVEIAYVQANLGAIWQYEGPAYYIGQ